VAATTDGWSRSRRRRDITLTGVGRIHGGKVLAMMGRFAGTRSRSRSIRLRDGRVRSSRLVGSDGDSSNTRCKAVIPLAETASGL